MRGDGMYGICVFDILRTMASLRTIQEIPIYSTGSRMVHRSSTSFVQDYIDQLPDDLFQKIIEIYLLDFKLFSYPIPTKS